MLRRPAFIAARTALLSLLFVLTCTHGAMAAPRAPVDDLLAGTAWSTDLDASGSTGLNDLAIFVCAFLGACPCPYEDCNPGPPGPVCDSNCPLAFPPCNCGSGVPASASNFTCDGNGAAGLGDFAIMATAFLTSTATGKCP